VCKSLQVGVKLDLLVVGKRLARWLEEGYNRGVEVAWREIMLLGAEVVVELMMLIMLMMLMKHDCFSRCGVPSLFLRILQRNRNKIHLIFCTLPASGQG
jgi:hypothetical protein